MEHMWTWNIFLWGQRRLVLESRAGFPDTAQVKFGTPSNGDTPGTGVVIIYYREKKILSSNLATKND